MWDTLDTGMLHGFGQCSKMGTRLGLALVVALLFVYGNNIKGVSRGLRLEPFQVVRGPIAKES